MTQMAYAVDDIPLVLDSETVTTETAETDTELDLSASDTLTSDNAETSPATEGELSAEALAFIEAAESLDRDYILEVSNNWGLAQKAWLKDTTNADLTAALDEAIKSLDEVQSQFASVEDLYFSVPEAEQSSDRVAAAYDLYASIYAEAMEHTSNPTEENTEKNPEETGESEEPDKEEIIDILFDEFPDKPLDCYIGESGLPVPVGETVFSISGWKTDISEKRFDTEALHAGSTDITVAKVEGKDYAVVPLLAQVEYPGVGGQIRVELPEDVKAVEYESFADDVTFMDESEAGEMLSQTYNGISGDVFGFYVVATHDFDVTIVYTDAEGGSSSHTAHVTIGSESDNGLMELKTVQEAAMTPSLFTVPGGNPPFTSGKITKTQYDESIGSWIIWFNGEPAYCADPGLNGRPSGCPDYNLVDTIAIPASSFDPNDHAGNQFRIWGTIIQDLESTTYSLSSADTQANNAYAEKVLWIAENFPDSNAAKIYANTQNGNSTSVYASGYGLYGYVYKPNASGWQRVIAVGELIDEDIDIPDEDWQDYNGSWSVSVTESASASDSFTFTYTINANKYQLDMLDKIQDAILEIEPVLKGGTIDGGTWEITPSTPQEITTSDHVMDDSFNTTGGQGTVSFTVTYNVTKSATSTASDSGTVGPFDTEEERDAAKAAAEAEAEARLSAQAQADAQRKAEALVAAAIATAKAQLQTLEFTYKETFVPYGFTAYPGEKGSNQTIIVNQGANEVFDMINDEWEVNVVINKVDSETGNQIAGDTNWALYEWDTVKQAYTESDRFEIIRGDNGEYLSHCKTNDKNMLFYTQRNAGKFIIVEQTAPEGYYGDWTDLENPGEPNTILGKRAYYIEITEANNESTIKLDNKDYDANISTSYTGGDKIVDANTGAEATVTISKASEEPAAEITYLESGRTYITDKSGKGYNEDSFTMTPRDDVFQNDRVVGEISISKVDLEAERYVVGSAAQGTAGEDGQKHGDATLDGAVYDLYAAEDIYHPDGVSGIVDYSKLTYADGTNIWHTTILENSGAWNSNYLPVLEKDNLVASAKIEDGWLTFSNLYLGRYYIVERGTGVVIPVSVGGAYYNDGEYQTINERTKEYDGGTAALAVENGQYTDWVYKNQFSNISVAKALDGTKVYDGYYRSFAEGYLCDQKNYYFQFEYMGEGSYVEKFTFGSRDMEMSGNTLKMDGASAYDLTILPPYEIDGLGKGYDDYYSNGESFSDGLDNTGYGKDVLIIKWDALTETRDQVAKTNIEISKHSSDTGSSDGFGIEGAGFTLYLISDLSKEKDIEKTPDGKYDIDSLIDLYINDEYDNEHLKYDFTGESQAIAKTYEIDADLIAAYNETLTAAGDNKNGSGNGWVATGNKNEYQLAEIFSNEDGVIGISGLPYGQYVVVETTTPENRWQAAPFIIDVDASLENNPESLMGIPNYATMTPSDANQNFRYNVNDEEVEMYLRIIKKDAQTGQNVLREGTAFQIYWMNEDGSYILNKDGTPKLVTMTVTSDGSVSKTVDTFYTTEEGLLALPEKLPVGHFRIVEVKGPEGFYNEWIDTAQYDENGILLESGNYYVDFEVTTDRIYWATGDDSEDAQDILVIEEKYWNNETLGSLTICKQGEVLTGWKKDFTSGFDPIFSGEAVDGNFTYETRPLAGAVFEIRAAEDILTQDNQVDKDGNRTVWYKKGDLVATVTTGDGTSDIEVFGPMRTNPTYDFLSVIHDGTIGEVTVTLPLGTYEIKEVVPPYGYTLNEDTSFLVTFSWDNETNDVVLASEIVSRNGDNGTSVDYEIVSVSDATEEQIEEQVLVFSNNRETPTPDDEFSKVGVGVYKRDILSGEFAAGAVFNLYTDDDIYDADGNLTFKAGDLVATSPETNTNGFTYFDVDVPIRGENYEADLNANKDTIGYKPAPENGIYDSSWNSGNYSIVEIRPPEGYYLEDTPMHVTFTYDGQVAQVVNATNVNMPTVTFVSKRDLTNDEELPGATLQIKDSEGNIFKEWVSTDTPERILGLHFDEEYTLVETRAADGYALANDIVFKIVPVYDEESGDQLQENDVYYKDGKDWVKLDDDTVVMKDDITKVQISKKDITNEKELPGAHLVIKDSKGNVVAEWTSTDKPHYIEKLPAGDYTLTEITAPDGYEVADTIHFTVQPTGKVQFVTMRDRPDDDTGILIHKVDAETKQPIQGVLFQIINQHTGKTVAYGVTNEFGNVWFDLPYGEYYYQELRVGAEYQVDYTRYPFSIYDAALEVRVEVENERTPLHGIITWIKDKGNNYKTGEEANGSGVEVTLYDETASTIKSSDITMKSIVLVAAGAVLVIGGGITVIVIRNARKNKKQSGADKNTESVED